MVGEWSARAIEVDERVPNGVAEGVVDRSPALVPDRAFVEGDGICGGGGGRRKPSAAGEEEDAEREEQREEEGGEEGGED